jgi:hypothetical protein
LSHEIELGRVGQTQAYRAEHDTVSTDPDMVLVEDLCDGVVPAGIQYDLGDSDTLGVDELVAWS